MKWLPIPGYEGIYDVSYEGQVRSVPRPGVRGGILKPRPTGSGHLRVALCREGQRVDVGIHRLVLEAFEGPCPAGLEARHLNDIPGDNRRENLRWGTRGENIRDRVANGIHPMSLRTKCPQGHALKAPNLRNTSTRGCKSCAHARSVAHSRGEKFDIAVADRKYRELMDAS